ncbi:unnamed protein product [Larinioides sclopetarius]|uniref:Uncharacterized protein n=1 Tax=Larinioides sclopetarius TaxID=280406 RepID=A0AAV2B6H1_9ARAC
MKTDAGVVNTKKKPAKDLKRKRNISEKETKKEQKSQPKNSNKSNPKAAKKSEKEVRKAITTMKTNAGVADTKKKAATALKPEK